MPFSHVISHSVGIIQLTMLPHHMSNSTYAQSVNGTYVDFAPLGPFHSMTPPRQTGVLLKLGFIPIHSRFPKFSVFVALEEVENLKR